MIERRQGGTIDDQLGSIWVILVHDREKRSTVLEVLSRPREQGGKRYCMAGVSGPGAEKYFNETSIYYFGS